jgi:hypothetical protein
MDAPIHPDLRELERRYTRIVDEYEAGHVSYEQARGLLRDLGVVDAEGAVWSIDEDGRFTRALPGGPPVPADPAGYVPPAPPPPPPGPSTWEQRRVPPFPRQGPPRRLADVEDVDGPIARRLPAPQLWDALGRWVRANRTTVAVAAVAVVVVVAMANRSGPRDRVAPGTVPASPGTTLTTMPTDHPTATTTVPAPQDQVPSQETAERVMASLASPDAARQAVADPGRSEVDVAWKASRFAGWAAVGWRLRSGPAAPTAPGRAVSDVQLVDVSSGAVVAAGKVEWVRAGSGGWKLAGWPELHRV